MWNCGCGRRTTTTTAGCRCGRSLLPLLGIRLVREIPEVIAHQSHELAQEL